MWHYLAFLNGYGQAQQLDNLAAEAGLSETAVRRAADQAKKMHKQQRR
jgi:hypothetical protein